MKHFIWCLPVLFIFIRGSLAQNNSDSTALLLIDIQEFYFPGGFSELYQPEKAATNAATILEHFRSANKTVIHVQHKTKSQMDIHPLVKPTTDEKIFIKTAVNSFKDTNLKSYLDSLHIKRLVIAGMMTHMCVEAASRAASDFEFEVVLIHNACTTKDLEYNGHTVPARDVHIATLATLKNYAKLVSTEEFLEMKSE